MASRNSSNPRPCLAETLTRRTKGSRRPRLQACAWSLLLITNSVFSGSHNSTVSRSSAVKDAEPSITSNTKSAAAALSLARRTPSCSTGSSVLRTPAASIKRTGKPAKTNCSSRVSRVVPATSVTIALDSPSIAFINELLPTLGRPRIKMLIPSRKARPKSKLSAS